MYVHSEVRAVWVKISRFQWECFKKPGNKQNLLQSFIYSKQKNIAVINSTIYFILQNIFIHNTDNFFMDKISIFEGLNVFSFLRLSILLLSMTIFSKTSFHIFLYSQKFVDIKILKMNCVNCSAGVFHSFIHNLRSLPSSHYLV